ncbi:signal peptide peptidase SppA [Campylobacter sp. faydin G-24]|uniref:Signal peptide peptidase SppA n=1 Tax=Campylobacter anatolicus TaxID=2829105 RepID=A0ABS5HJS0_9BACT|nr:signal peptide peptidase SppA [Campylobacter anatolicus]MBR8464311.1 signal peptide peptidase SppA [Campylobacter anatolicus]
MQILKVIFTPILAVFKFINNYFKVLIFVMILFVLFVPNKPIMQPNLVRIDINGMILDTDEIITQLEKARVDESIKGVLLYIDSPGGALSPSVELFMQISRLKQSKKVIAYAAGSMTSGSYYAGAGADKIYANPGAFIGSIGVIMQAPNISELAHKIGISEQIVKAGEFKEAGTFTREWNQTERKSLQTLVDGAYELFVSDVAKARNLDIKMRDEWANARVFLANDALKMGLIDNIGGYFDAVNELIRLSEVSEPVWQEKPKIEKILENLTKTGINSLITLFFSSNLR